VLYFYEGFLFFNFSYMVANQEDLAFSHDELIPGVNVPPHGEYADIDDIFSDLLPERRDVIKARVKERVEVSTCHIH